MNQAVTDEAPIAKASRTLREFRPAPLNPDTFEDKNQKKFENKK